MLFPSVHLTYLGQRVISHSPSMPCAFMLSCLYTPVFFVPMIASPASSSKSIMKLSSSSPARKYPPSLLPKHSLHPTCWDTSFFLLVISHVWKSFIHTSVSSFKCTALSYWRIFPVPTGGPHIEGLHSLSFANFRQERPDPGHSNWFLV